MRICPDANTFGCLAQKHDLIAIHTDISTDIDTPISLYRKLVGDNQGFMLESAEADKRFGRYSFIGTLPLVTIVSYPEHSDVTLEGTHFVLREKPLSALKKNMQRFSFYGLDHLPFFSGGAVGYFAYESVGTWERVKGMNLDESTILAEFMICQVMAVMDHLTHSATLIYVAKINHEEDVQGQYDQAVSALQSWKEKLSGPAVMPEAASQKANPSLLTWDEKKKEKFIQKVEAAKEYIKAGDIFQVVLSEAFQGKLPNHPFSLYRRLRRKNPSPYMFYLDFGKRKLVGASPEMLVKAAQKKAYTYPIAGTRPRGKTKEEDEALAVELLADTKELAEHAMLVDLGRNDIGRISLPGTVDVVKMMQIEKFSHVMHIVSEVNGQIHPDYDAFDVLSACFPAGTVSGAPKIRAMEIINELEAARRGPYAGAVGYFDFSGNMDVCITIRTFMIDGEDVTVQAGAGIVADSVPEKEFQEILHKAGILFQVLTGDE